MLHECGYRNLIHPTSSRLPTPTSIAYNDIYWLYIQSIYTGRRRLCWCAVRYSIFKGIWKIRGETRGLGRGIFWAPLRWTIGLNIKYHLAQGMLMYMNSASLCSKDESRTKTYITNAFHFTLLCARARNPTEPHMFGNTERYARGDSPLESSIVEGIRGWYGAGCGGSEGDRAKGDIVWMTMGMVGFCFDLRIMRCGYSWWFWRSARNERTARAESEGI